MAKFVDISGKFIVASLVIISLFSFLIIIQSDNSAEDPLIEDPLFNESLQLLLDEIAVSTQDAEEKYGVFNEEEPKPGFGSIVLFGVVSVGKTFSSIVFGFFGAIIKLPLVILGVSETVYSLVLTWLIIGIIVALWLFYKLGG